ncbi:neuropeptide SIFamide receptor-like [Oppia nitens]|uniref:neuropeptide SIFamide receptor-like n=1 Tax=Oppia nitens TaxID=1686743 RepID=UPI0023DAD4CB|nr:neuropeptide SIFamide receptor-like [Oppia nitens]
MTNNFVNKTLRHVVTDTNSSYTLAPFDDRLMQELVSAGINGRHLGVDLNTGAEHQDLDDYIASLCNLSFGCYLRHSITWTIAYLIAYIIVFLIGLIGNLSVLWIIYALRKQTNSSVSVSSNKVFYRFVGNLALADLLVVLFCLPPTLIGNIFGPWLLGRFICKAVPYLQGVSVNASVYTLVAISIDRFYAIYYPLGRKCGKNLCRIVITLIWILSFGVSFPWLIYFELMPMFTEKYTELQICQDVWPTPSAAKTYFLVVNLGFQYLLPLSIIAFFYILILLKIGRRRLPKLARHLPANLKDGNQQSNHVIERSKIKVFKMLIVIVMLFALSWLPLYVIFAFIKLGPTLDENSWTTQLLTTGAPIAQWLGASNSCVNPILYFFFNNKFRSFYKNSWKKTFSCLSSQRDDKTIVTAV